MHVEDASSSVYLIMSADQLQVLGYANTYSVDLSEFQTIRVALDGEGGAFVWLNDAPLYSSTSSHGDVQQADAQFYAYPGSPSSSYWDYVAYSSAFLPVPEPPSPLALGLGLLPLAGVALRKRR